MAQGRSGLHREALATTVRMVEVAPLSMIALFSATIRFVNTPYDDGVRVEQLVGQLQALDESYGLAARGGVALNRGHVVDAVRHYYRSIELDPGRSLSRTRLRRILLGDLGLVEEAMLVDPRMDTLDVTWLRSDGDSVIRLARERYADEPSSDRARFNLMMGLGVFPEKMEEAMSLARSIFNEFETRPQQIGGLLDMAWIAAAAEYPDEARQWREFAAADLQSRIESGMYGSRVETRKAKLAMLDQRKGDAIEALERAMALGTRMSWVGESPQYASLRDDPRFHALVNRMLDTIAEERKQVVAMLCGPNPIIMTWQPATETCAQFSTDSP